jgi:hypothetical protein
VLSMDTFDMSDGNQETGLGQILAYRPCERAFCKSVDNCLLSSLLHLFLEGRQYYQLVNWGGKGFTDETVLHYIDQTFWYFACARAHPSVSLTASRDNNCFIDPFLFVLMIQLEPGRSIEGSLWKSAFAWMKMDELQARYNARTMKTLLIPTRRSRLMRSIIRIESP